MDATTTLTPLHATGFSGPTPLLRVASDERLVSLTRAGNEGAYEVLVARYQARLLAFCRHMLSSKEDAEDVLQEVFAAAYNALLQDEREINVRPWLYRIARNRSLNHLRKKSAIGVDSMDIHLADNGTSTADRVHQREEFRQLMSDVQTLPETQRTALLLREIDALSYDQIAEAMDTTVPSVKSLLVRARVSLAEAAEARTLTCEEVRDELAEIAEGLVTMSPPVRRHVKQCSRCADFRRHLKANNKQLAAIFPLGPLLLLKKFVLAQAGGSAAAAGTAAAGSSGALGAGVSTIASKAAAGMAAAAIVTAGAVEVDHAQQTRARRPSVPVMANVAKPTPPPAVLNHDVQRAPREVEAPKAEPAKAETAPAATTPAPAAAPAPVAPPQQQTDSTSLPPQGTAPATTPTVPVAPPATTPTTPTTPDAGVPPSAPVAPPVPVPDPPAPADPAQP